MRPAWRRIHILFERRKAMVQEGFYLLAFSGAE
jgi:hypothetical protein